jgi:hypothetical protein
MGFISKWLTKNKVTVSPDSGFPIIITRLPRRSSSDLHRRISSSNSPTTMNPAFFPSPALESGPYPTPSISHDEEYNIFHPQIQYHPQSGVPYPMKASIYALPPLPSALPIPIVAINDENMPPVKVAQLTDEREESIQALALPPDTCPRSTVNILVESDGKCQSFTLHRDLLCYYSPYFRDLLASLDDKDVQTEKKAMIQAHMLHREWRWGDAADVVKNMEVEGPGNADGKVEVTVKVKLPETVRDVRLDTAKVGDVTRMVFAAFVEVSSIITPLPQTYIL